MHPRRRRPDNCTKVQKQIFHSIDPSSRKIGAIMSQAPFLSQNYSGGPVCQILVTN